MACQVQAPTGPPIGANTWRCSWLAQGARVGLGEVGKLSSKMIQMDDGAVKFTVLCGWQKKAPVESNAVRRDRGWAVINRP